MAENRKAAKACANARRYCDLSAQFYDAYAAYAASRSVGQTADNEVAIYLISHSLELALKGWLMLRQPGVTAQELAKAYGHDLGQLAVNVSPHYPEIGPYVLEIAKINLSYRAKGYEYPDLLQKGYVVPTPLQVYADIARDCCRDLEERIDRESRQGVQSEGGPP